MPNIPIENCTGCTACYSVCPCRAITMRPDAEGFSYPFVDNDVCVGCGLCERVCPVIETPSLNGEYKAAFVARSKEKEVISECTSGGFLDELCRYVINELHGYAVGVAYDSEYMPYHKICTTYDEAIELRNSKYAQSELGDAFADIKRMLTENKTVLFIGTPCQSAGLVSYIGKINAGELITADLVCRSIPSRKLWKEHLSSLTDKYNSDIKSVACRRKTYGYHSGALEIEFENGKKYAASNRTDTYMKSFHSDVCSRYSCYSCAFKTAHRCTDLTVFDCWDPEMVTGGACIDDDRGYTSVIAHTERASEIIASMNRIEKYTADAEKMLGCTGGMATSSIQLPKGRESYYADVLEHGYLQGAAKHIRISAKDKVIEALKPLKYRIKLLLKK